MQSLETIVKGVSGGHVGRGGGGQQSLACLFSKNNTFVVLTLSLSLNVPLDFKHKS